MRAVRKPKSKNGLLYDALARQRTGLLHWEAAYLFLRAVSALTFL
jgi:hypothetical protein